jgi:hypothetical protein
MLNLLMHHVTRTRSWSELIQNLGIRLQGIKEKKTFSHISKSTGRDLNPGPPKYDLRALTAILESLQ